MDNISPVLQFNRRRRHQHNGRRHYQQYQRGHDVQAPLHKSLFKRKSIISCKQQRRVKQVNIIRAPQNNIRYLGQHVSANRFLKAVFHNLISLLGRNIPDNHAFILLDTLIYMLHSLIYIYHLADIIFIIPRINLLFQPKSRPLPAYQDHFPRRKYLSVYLLEYIRPYGDHNKLEHGHPNQRPRIYKMPVQEADLYICNCIYTDHRQHMGVDRIPFSQEAYLQPSVGMGKKKQKNSIQSSHQPVSLAEKGKLDIAGIEIHPHKPI